MNYISKHFTTDGCNELILEAKDWTEEQFNAFRKLFGLEEAERIAISEYKLEAWGKPEISEDDEAMAMIHLGMIIDEYMELGMAGKRMLYETLLPLKRRYDSGERTRELYDAIMAIN